MMVGEIMCMSHDPLPVFGVLPGHDGFGRGHGRVNSVGDIESMEVDFH